MDETQEYNEAMMDRALQEYPMAPLPEGFVAQVMAQVARAPQWQPAPFRLHFLDVAAPLATAIFTYCTIFLILWFTGWIEVGWLPAAQFETTFVGEQIAAAPLAWLSLIVVVLVGEIGLLAFVGSSLWGERPFQYSVTRNR